jgi:nuclear factor erythroid 2-related factor 1/3
MCFVVTGCKCKLIKNSLYFTVSSTSVASDIGIKSTVFSPQVPTSNIDTLTTFQRSGQHEVKRISPSAKKLTETKSKSLKTDDLLSGLSENKIIDMPVSEFNLFLEKLPEEQAKYVRDVRRRGKNKEAARICRKRKIDAIDDIDDELEMMKDEKKRVLEERSAILEETAVLKSKISELENSVFSSMRDENGQPLSSLEYSMFQGSNGAVYVGKTIADKKNNQERS